MLHLVRCRIAMHAFAHVGGQRMGPSWCKPQKYHKTETNNAPERIDFERPPLSSSSLPPLASCQQSRAIDSLHIALQQCQPNVSPGVISSEGPNRLACRPGHSTSAPAGPVFGQCVIVDRCTAEPSMMLKQLLVRLCNQLMSQSCLLCSASSGRNPLCEPCEIALPGLGDYCPVCALPSPHRQICGNCLSTPPHFDHTVALWAYAYPLDKVMHAYKYRARLELAPWFAAPLAASAGRDGARIIAMPLHPQRLAERGFNQAHEIARHIARLSNGTLLHSAVRRLGQSQPQSELPLKQRPGNVRNAFASEMRFHGAPLLVVDDVMTTGSTLNELARTLKRAGAGKITNLVVGRTLMRNDRAERNDDVRHTDEIAVAS